MLHRSDHRATPPHPIGKSVPEPPARDESAFPGGAPDCGLPTQPASRTGGFVPCSANVGRRYGKGLLARRICIIAFGREPHAVTAGATSEELEKRIAAELTEGSPALFLDSLNTTAFKYGFARERDHGRPAKVRVLGGSQMVPLNSSTFVILTGNGLTVSQDLARRFIGEGYQTRLSARQL
jgi:hypothetical protein